MRPNRIVFVDIDGVLNNRSGYRAGNIDEYGRKPDPACVASLNRITDATGAGIVVSSTWRIAGLMRMRETFRAWGVTAPVFDITPKLFNYRGDIAISVPRGREIAAWLANNKTLYSLQSFVILDDNADMEHLAPYLILTTFEHGLTPKLAEWAISILTST